MTQPAPPPMIYVQPSKHMSVGGFLVAVLVIIVLFVVFAMFFVRSSVGGICGLAVWTPLPILVLQKLRRRTKVGSAPYRALPREPFAD